MRTARCLIVVLAGAGLALGCSKDEKKDEAKAESAETAAKGDAPEVPAPSTGGGSELAEVSPGAGAGMAGMPKLPGAATLGMLMGDSKPPAAPSPARGLFSGRFEMDKVLGDGEGAAAAPVAAEQKKAPAPPAPTAGAGDCQRIGTHVVGLLRSEMDDMPADAIAEMGNEVAKMCTRDKWSAQGKACVLAATSADALDACGEALGYGDGDGDDDDDDSPAPVASKRGTPNDPRCPKVVDALIKVMLAEVPEAQRAQVEPMFGQAKQQLLTECNKGTWPDAFMKCALTSKNQQDLQTCAMKLGGM